MMNAGSPRESLKNSWKDKPSDAAIGWEDVVADSSDTCSVKCSLRSVPPSSNSSVVLVISLIFSRRSSILFNPVFQIVSHRKLPYPSPYQAFIDIEKQHTKLTHIPSPFFQICRPQYNRHNKTMSPPRMAMGIRHPKSSAHSPCL